MRSLPILTYHSVSAVTSGELVPYSLRPELFADHMRMLSEMSYSVWSVDQIGVALQERRPLPERIVGLTFDDAFVDFADEALPVLEIYGFGATLYIPTAFLGSHSAWLTTHSDRRAVLPPETIAGLPARGIECGAHSHTHPELDRLGSAALASEVVRPRAILEELTGHPVTSFAYPYGYHSRRTRLAVRRAGYSYACGTGHEPAWPEADLLSLPRLIVYADTTAEALLGLLERPASIIRHRAGRVKQTIWRVNRATARTDGGRALAERSVAGAHDTCVRGLRA